MVPVLRTAYFGGPWACLTSRTGPRWQHSLHALPNKLLGKPTLCILSMKGYFSMVCSIDQTSCSAVVCDKHVPLWPLWCYVPPADETSADFLIPDALLFLSLRTRLCQAWFIFLCQRILKRRSSADTFSELSGGAASRFVLWHDRLGVLWPAWKQAVLCNSSVYCK